MHFRPRRVTAGTTINWGGPLCRDLKYHFAQIIQFLD